MDNLYNIAEGKTKKVIEYIESLKSDAMSGINPEKFGLIKMVALKAVTANEMLRIIGYKYGLPPTIYGRSAY